jgi:hypothetical protein
MANMLRRNAVLNLVSNGIDNAIPIWDKIYKYHKAPEQQRFQRNEQFFSSFVSHELQKQSIRIDGFCTHETSHFALEAAVARAKKRERKYSLDNRYDLVLWRNGSTVPVPYALIEMKLDYRFHRIVNDAEKVCRALQILGTCSAGTLKHAYLAFPAMDRKTITADEGVDEAIDKLERHLHGETIGTQSHSPLKAPLLKKNKHIKCLQSYDGQSGGAAVIRISSQMVAPAD